MDNMIQIKDISHTYGDKQVLKEVNLDIKSNEIFGLLGPSGAGKTTLIKILTGQLQATKGKSYIDQLDTIYSKKKIYERIGVMMDIAGLYERLSCYENLLLYAQIHKVNKLLINEVLKKVGLLEAINTVVCKLSTGMRQRLLFARAILHSPLVLFLDEPTRGLDPVTSDSIHQFIKEIRDEDTTIFLCTHNMEEATKLCDNIGLLQEGKIIEYGNPKEICRKYNEEDTFTVICKSGEQLTLKNNETDRENIIQLFRDNNVMSIHSSEPNLESVFIKLTGKGLV
ncbi:ABC transporter ATP-binding protein [Anaerocolumna sp. MB42-C2]|uniref:ABC transporter ATP-binding protein n=1 Tax=Anaerocolumna sp. MB42-C2 TaxID=3070997 RepID=UPI0027E0185F|nr:ABC transporter ATP-binding protein [Anaerocolumna sp. MB42-C2]WMJ86958.1 ABC transporter ATP-binding protein [Anaerocolumna sp. MB42-C2]